MVIPYFDSFATIGPRPRKHPRERWRVEELLAAMDRCGIDATLVTHEVAARYEPRRGNELLFDEIGGHDRLYPCWVVLPADAGDFLPPAELLAQMRERGVRAAKVFPSRFKFPLESLAATELMQALESEGVLLLIELPETDASSVQRLCERFPNLRVLLQKIDWRQLRPLLPVLRSCQNLYVELSNLQNHRSLEYLHDLVGPERLLFGTEAPVKSPGAARALIDYSDLSGEAKRQVAGENLRRLLGLPPLRTRAPESLDPLIRLARRGQPLSSETVIDAHAHILGPGVNGAAGIVMPSADPDGMLPTFHKLGVQKLFVSSYLGIWADSMRGNQELREAVRRYPDELVGYVTLDPTHMSAQEIEREIRTYHVRERWPGLKPYFPHNELPLTSPLYRRWWEFANEHRLFALIHFDLEKTEAEVDELAERYPDIAFLCAHSGATFPFAEMVAALAERHSNVYLELTITNVPLTIIEYLVERVGSERVLFGTDAPMRDPRPQFGWVVYSELDLEAKRDVLGGNALRLLRRVRW